jgi:hypothetical protein
LIHMATGYWMPVFGLAVGMDVLTGMLALFALKAAAAALHDARSVRRSPTVGQPSQVCKADRRSRLAVLIRAAPR